MSAVFIVTINNKHSGREGTWATPPLYPVLLLCSPFYLQPQVGWSRWDFPACQQNNCRRQHHGPQPPCIQEMFTSWWIKILRGQCSGLRIMVITNLLVLRALRGWLERARWMAWVPLGFTWALGTDRSLFQALSSTFAWSWAREGGSKSSWLRMGSTSSLASACFRSCRQAASVSLVKQHPSQTHCELRAVPATVRAPSLSALTVPMGTQAQGYHH